MMLTTTAKQPPPISALTAPVRPPRSIDEALEILLRQPATPDVETRSLLQAQGCVLAKPVYAKIDSPSFNNSAMDGYAVNSDTRQNLYPISQRICAGDQPSPLQAGTAARIFTGAPIPEGADTVVAQEDCTISNSLLQINAALIKGHHIRPRREEYHSGQPLLVSGIPLSPQDLALCATSGNHQLQTYNAPRVALITCGNELVNSDNALEPGQIYNSNLNLLHGLINDAGGIVTHTHTLPDQLNATKSLLEQLSTQVDIIISSGGVSSGDQDYLPQAISDTGNVHFWRLAIKPGKPVLFGDINHTPILALPGNPCATFVTFTLLAKPLIKHHLGQTSWQAFQISAKANFDKHNSSTRDHYLFVQFQHGQITLFNSQRSNQILPAVNCNALLLLPAGNRINKGQQVDILLYSDRGCHYG